MALTIFEGVQAAETRIGRIRAALMDIETATRRKMTPVRVQAVQEAYDLLHAGGDSRETEAAELIIDLRMVVGLAQQQAIQWLDADRFSHGWSTDILD